MLIVVSGCGDVTDEGEALGAPVTGMEQGAGTQAGLKPIGDDDERPEGGLGGSDGGSDGEGGSGDEGGGGSDAGPVCGDGVVEGAEQCEVSEDGPAELCNNGIDDDGDGLLDCWDPDCLVTRQICTDACTIVTENKCKPILNDPATICPSPKEPGISNYSIHARGEPTVYTDIRSTDMRVELYYKDATTPFFATTIPGSGFVKYGSEPWGVHWKYTAADPNAVGLKSVTVKKRKMGGKVSLNWYIEGKFPFDWSMADTDIMQQVSFGNEVFFTDHYWIQGPRCLKLPNRFF